MATQTEILETVSYLLGERTVPTTALEGRKNFIQRTVEEIYRSHPWSFAAVTATLPFVNGSAVMPDDFDDQHKLYAYYSVGDNKYEMREINYGDQDAYISGDNKMYLLSDEDGGYTLNTVDNVSSIQIKYQAKPPVLSSNTSTPFQDLMKTLQL